MGVSKQLLRDILKAKISLFTLDDLFSMLGPQQYRDPAFNNIQ